MIIRIVATIKWEIFIELKSGKLKLRIAFFSIFLGNGKMDFHKLRVNSFR